MTKTSNTTLVLDFSRVSGLARKVLVKNVLTVLTALGFKFAHAPICPLDITRLVVNAKGNKQNLLFFSNEVNPTWFGEVKIFDVTTDYLTFLDEARPLVEIKIHLDSGATVIVTPNHTDVDLRGVVADALTVANLRRQTLFG